MLLIFVNREENLEYNYKGNNKNRQKNVIRVKL